MAVTFDTLKTDATIFAELRKNPEWWQHFKEEPSLYIEIRKDNQVNVYFEGGSVARIHYCSKHKKLQVFTHHKYLMLPAPSKSSLYVECSDFIKSVYEKSSLKKISDDAIEYETKTFDEALGKFKLVKRYKYKVKCIDMMLERIKMCYSQKNTSAGSFTKEDWSEKYIQGSLIVNNCSTHLDSEFAYNDAQSKIRIDLIKCVDGVVTFVELKRINDGRMLHEDDNTPIEIVEQMERYRQFVEKYKAQLLTYYQRVYDIKKSLGLPVPNKRPEKINLTPELLIFDGWEKSTEGRRIHRERMYNILKEKDIKFNTITEI